MKRVIGSLLLLGLVACNGQTPSPEVQDLQKRVAQLEKRVKTLEQEKAARQAAKGAHRGPQARDGRGGAGKGQPGAAKGQGGAKAGAQGGAKAGAQGTAKAGAAKGEGAARKPVELGLVKITGDAKRVVLAQGKRRVRVPGKAPVGEYAVMASFAEEGPLEKAGEITVEAKKAITVACAAADKACAATAE